MAPSLFHTMYASSDSLRLGRLSGLDSLSLSKEQKVNGKITPINLGICTLLRWQKCCWARGEEPVRKARGAHARRRDGNCYRGHGERLK